MLADVFNCQKQQIWPFPKRKELWFPHCESLRPRFSYENPSALFYRCRKPKANYPPPNRYLPKLVVGCPWSLEWIVYSLPVWKLGNDLDSTKKLWQRSHLFLSHLKQPFLWWVDCPSSAVLKRDGASSSLRFFDRRKAGMTEPRGKSSFNLGLEL